MTVNYKDYSIDIIDDRTFSINSADNLTHYDKEYFTGSINEDRFYPTSKHGIRISRGNTKLTSVIICEVGGSTTIHENCFVISNDSLYICCCDKVYSLKFPDLSVNWSQRLDPATCLSIYSFDNAFIIHGELVITKIDRDGNIIWEFGARDIFVTQDGTDSIAFQGDHILLKDWEGFQYLLDKNGVEIV